jgi:hypothetical protein
MLEGVKLEVRANYRMNLCLQYNFARKSHVQIDVVSLDNEYRRRLEGVSTAVFL